MKKMFTVAQKGEMCKLYLSGLSCLQVADHFGVTGNAISYHLKRNGVALRTPTEDSAARWLDPEFRANQIAKRIGKPSGALGKNWQVGRRVYKPGLRGSGNPNWKGGTTRLGFAVRALPEYAVWRMSVFKRDRYTCVLCGAKNRKGQKYVFDADHIRPLAKLFEDHGITTVDEAICCAALWDISNGRCLCRACHKKTETWGPNIQPRKQRVTAFEPVESVGRKQPRRNRKTFSQS